MEILTKYINLNIIIIIDEELYNFTTIRVYIAINIDIKTY
jgi:hypothetical protein